MMPATVASDARARVDRIKVGVEAVWHLIVESYQARDWEALGYATWDEMCTREFGTSRLRLPREERAETVHSLRDAGLSLRAIASATGYSEPTVRRTLAPASNDAPEWVDAETGEVIEPDEPVLTEAECEAIEEARTGEKITGLDGKRYAPSKPAPTPSAPPRKPITDEFRGLALDLDRITGRVIKLAADDRFKKNADQISQSYLHDLIRARDALQRVIDQLSDQKERTS